MPTPFNHPCNLCLSEPKAKRQQYCKKCFSKVTHEKYLAKRKELMVPIESLENEIWVEIENAPNYFISNMGRVKTNKRFAEEGREGLIKLRQSRVGSYLKVDIDKHNIRPFVHRLVAKYFVENPENKPFVNHINLDKQDNRALNLEWVTRSENGKHFNENSGKRKRHKLTKEQVLEIYHSEEKIQDLALKYNVQTSTIFMVKNGYSWSKITNHENNDYKKRKTSKPK